MKTHYLVTTIEVTENSYEVWADNEEQALAELDNVQSDRVYPGDTHRHEPEVVCVSEVVRRFQC